MPQIASETVPRCPQIASKAAHAAPLYACRYKAFLDKWRRKKSLVDTIFIVGHWGKGISAAAGPCRRWRKHVGAYAKLHASASTNYW